MAVSTDNFSDTHLTLLAAHTSDTGESWSLLSAGGSATINAITGPNVPAARAVGSSQLWEWSAVGADGTLEATEHNLGGGGTPRGGIFFREVSNTSYWQVLLEGSGPDSTLRLQSIGGGSTNVTTTITGKLEGTIRVEFNGSSIEVFFDDVSELTATDSFNVTETGMGLAVGNTGSGGTTTEWSVIEFTPAAAGAANTGGLLQLQQHLL